jgi:hypothetical protein
MCSDLAGRIQCDSLAPVRSGATIYCIDNKYSRQYHNPVRVTFDPAKDASNKAKHGLPLEDARGLDWDAALVWEDQRRDYGEVRYVALVPRLRHLYFVAFTVRAGTTRIISLRRANLREIERYETEADSTDA